MLRVSKVWTFSIQIAFALVAVVFAGSFTHIQAAPTCTTIDVLPGGEGTISDALLVPGFCVQSTDKLYGTWNLGTLPAGGEATFAISGTGAHSITFGAAFQDGGSYTPSYEVSTTLPNFFTSMSADITQTMGTATLGVSTTPAGTTPIFFVKNANVVTGTAFTNFSGAPTDILVTDNFFPITGSDASAVLNTFIEGVQTVPEPLTLELLGIGLIGFASFGLRRKSSE